MEILKGANLVLAFGLELAMLAAFGYFGFQSAHGSLLQWVLALALPVAAAGLWAAVLAPKATRRLTLVPGMIAEFGMFLLGAAALYGAGQPVAAIAMAVAATVHGALGFAWNQW